VSESGTDGLTVLVVGAGAVGGYFGGMLARAGVPVTLVGREPHVSAMARDGLRIQSHDFDERVRVRATLDVADVRGADVVLVCVKTLDTTAAARAIAPGLAPDALVISLQNGVENVDAMRAAGVEAVPAVVYVAAALAGPGHVRHTGRGDLIVEAPRDAARAATLARLAARFAGAGVPCRVVADAQPELWMKLVLNCAFNAISALGQARYARIANDPAAWTTLTRALDEAVAVADACHVRLPGDVDVVTAARALALAMPDTMSSTAQDLARGKRTEIAALNGYVARRGAELGVPTPVNQALTALVQLLEDRDRSA
jgi:2-dehydropantoate 2-reductase